MVARFHEAGLEVILDVVYNHTAEGNELGPTLSFKGIDNASYYRLIANDQRHYINDTGTGNTLNLSHARVIQMVTDSLRYWVQLAHVDGFRFDLGTILAREPNGFDNQSGFLKAVSQDPVLGSIKLIAEPWDCGPGGYQVGAFPPGMGRMERQIPRYRSRFLAGRGAIDSLGGTALRLGGAFNHQGRRPWASINFISAHDGFTLKDVVSYNQKHNETNGDGKPDGTSTIAPGIAVSKGLRTIRHQCPSLAADSKHARLTFVAQGTPDDVAGERIRADAVAETITPIARTTK